MRMLASYFQKAILSVIVCSVWMISSAMVELHAAEPGPADADAPKEFSATPPGSSIRCFAKAVAQSRKPVIR